MKTAEPPAVGAGRNLRTKTDAFLSPTLVLASSPATLLSREDFQRSEASLRYPGLYFRRGDVASGVAHPAERPVEDRARGCTGHRVASQGFGHLPGAHPNS